MIQYLVMTFAFPRSDSPLRARSASDAGFSWVQFLVLALFGFVKNPNRALSITQLPAIVLGSTRLRNVGMWGVRDLGP
jgi:hypothetical protein